MITNPMWAVLKAHVVPTGCHAYGAKPETSDRVFLEALLDFARTGCPWRDLSAGFGSWDAAYNRFRRWVRSGRLRKLFEALTERPELGDLPRVFIDSTVLRPTPTPPGAAKKSASGVGRPTDDPLLKAAVGRVPGVEEAVADKDSTGGRSGRPASTWGHVAGPRRVEPEGAGGGGI